LQQQQQQQSSNVVVEGVVVEVNPQPNPNLGRSSRASGEQEHVTRASTYLANAFEDPPEEGLAGMVPRNDEERELFELFNTAIGYGLSNEDAVRRMIENYRDGNFTFGHYANLWRGRNAAAARGVNAAAARVEPAPVRPGLGREATGLHLLLWPSSSAPVAKSTAPAGLPPLVLKAKVSGELLDVVVAMSAGERNAECSICFEYLHEQPQGQLCCGPAQRAACGHFFHHACALNLLNSNTRTSRKCPICRASYDRVKPVPQLTADPDGWFAAVDTGGEGYLSRRQVLNVLVAQYPVDLVKLEESFDELWERWDVTESGYLTKAEFVHPERGLLNFVRANLLHEPVVAPASPEPSPSAATHAATGTSSLAQPPSPVPPSPRPVGVRSNEDSNAPRTPSTIMHAYAPPACELPRAHRIVPPHLFHRISPTASFLSRVGEPRGGGCALVRCVRRHAIRHAHTRPDATRPREERAPRNARDCRDRAAALGGAAAGARAGRVARPFRRGARGLHRRRQ
jgi:hypothetical protein